MSKLSRYLYSKSISIYINTSSVLSITIMTTLNRSSTTVDYAKRHTQMTDCIKRQGNKAIDSCRCTTKNYIELKRLEPEPTLLAISFQGRK